MKIPLTILLLCSIPVMGQKVAVTPTASGRVTLNGLALGGCPDAYAVTRVAPAGFSSLPIMPTCVWSPGNVALSTTLDAAYKATYSSVMSGPYIFVDTVSGNDSTCAVNSSFACATISKALRSTTATQVFVKCPGTGVVIAQGNASLDYRYTDTGAGAPKLLFSQTPGCKLRFTGDNIATNTWTATGGHTGVYQTTIASAVGGTSGAISNVLYADGTMDGSGYVDEWGSQFPKRLQSAAPNNWFNAFTYQTGDYTWVGSYSCYQATAPNTNSQPPSANWTSCGDIRGNDTAGLANLDRLCAASVPGWWYSTTLNVLYVCNGTDLTNPTNAAKLQARYCVTGASFGNVADPRMLVYGATLMIEGFYLDGIGVETLQYFDGVSYHNPTVYEQNDTIFAAASYGTEVRGATVYAQSVVAHANFFDGWNSDIGTDGTTYSTMALYNVWSNWNGDPNTYNSNVIPNEPNNNNGSSSHNGYAAYIGSVFEANVGPDIADTSSTSSSPVTPSATWVVGSIARNVNALNLFNVGGFQFQGVSGSFPGDSRNRSFWIDLSQGL